MIIHGAAVELAIPTIWRASRTIPGVARCKRKSKIMQYKTASYLSLLFFFIIGASFVLGARELPAGRGHDFGPAFVPTILGVALMVFCILGAFGTYYQTANERLTISNPFSLAVTFGISIVYVALWYFVGQFYLWTFLAVAMLIFFLNPSSAVWSKLRLAVVIGLGLTFGIYFVFEFLLNVRF